MRSLVGGILDAVAGGAAKPPVPYAPTRATSFQQAVSNASAAPSQQQVAAMGSTGTLFSIIARITENLAQVGWHLYRTAKPGTPPEHRVEVTSHAALDLWNRPNAFFSRQEFVESFAQHLELTGEAWWLVSKSGNLPLELWPVRPDRMTPVPSTQKFLAGYTYRSPDGDKIPLDLDEVVFLRRPNPEDPYRGIGPVQSILTDIDSARYSAEWNRNFFVNSAEPGGIIMVDKRLSDDEFDEMVRRWRQQHQGVAQAHRVAVLEQGQWVDRKFSQRDMQFAELRSVSQGILREAFGIAKTMLGQTEDTNRATAQTAEVVFARWLLVPRLERIKQALNNDLLPMFGRTGVGVEFDYDSPIPVDEELEQSALTTRANAASVLVTAGWEPAAVLETVGLPPMPHTGTAPSAAPGQPGQTDETESGQGESGELVDTTGQDRQDDIDWGLFGGDTDEEEDSDKDAAEATNRRPAAGWDPAKHPRDRKGRFTSSRTSKLTEAERATARDVMSGFQPKQFASGGDADAYVMGGPKLTQSQIDAVDTYSGDAFFEINRKLRAGGDVSDDTTIKNLRAAMKPTDDDLILTRTVSFEAFPKGMNLKDLAGMKVKDAAFSSTSLGAAYGGTLGNVRMKIAVPKGTPAVFAAKYSRNPHEREIILGDGLEFAVASVTKNDQYGYDMSLIVLPTGATTARAVAREMLAALAAPTTRPAAQVAPPPLPDPPDDGTPAELPDGAGPDPEPVQQAWEAALATAIVLWLLHSDGSDDDKAQARYGVAGLKGDLVEQVRDAVHAGDLLALTRLTVDTTAAGDALGAQLVEVAEAAARHVVTEAAAQGVSTGTGAVDRAALQQTGQLAAATLGDGLRISAAREAARVWGPGVSADTVAAQVADQLQSLTAAQPEYVLGGALTGAQAAGREATMLAGPSAALYASEQNDRNTCGPCRAVDGRWVGNSDDPLMPWRELYPVRGYVSCLGGDRCRGQLVAIWRGGKDWKKWVEKEPVERGGAI